MSLPHNIIASTFKTSQSKPGSDRTVHHFRMKVFLASIMQVPFVEGVNIPCVGIITNTWPAWDSVQIGK